VASDTFAKVRGIKGESLDDKHKDQIEVLAWSWGVTQAEQHGGGGAGKPRFRDLSLTHRIDKASPLLLRACATGQHIEDATITRRRAAGRPDFLVITMTDVIVTSVTESDSGSDGDAEVVTLAFAKVDVEYRPQNPDGSLGAGIHFTYDTKAA
jgi:type VI secretion system secreted protein Hcp